MTTPKTPRVIAIVLDGLRPDVIDERRTPHIARLKTRGTWFARSRTVFPSMTRVATASFATGAEPQAHGVVANALYLPDFDADRVHDFSTESKIADFQRRTGQPYLGIDTFADRLAAAGLAFAFIHTGSGASAHLVSPRRHQNGQWALPMSAVGTPDEPDEHAPIADRFGPPPQRTMPDTAYVEHVATLFVDHVLAERQPDMALLWLHEPDTTWHYRGMGSDEGAAAVKAADAAVGRVMDWLDGQPDGDRCTLMVLSDHGHMAVAHEIDLYGALTAMGHPCRHMSAGALNDDALAVTGWTVGSVTARDGGTSRLEAIAEWLQAQDFVGAILSPGEPGATEGRIPGTLPLHAVDNQHARQAPLMFTTVVDDNRELDGISGVGPMIGGAPKRCFSMHGGLSAAELCNTLIAAGPGFEAGNTDDRVCGLIDVAPTVLDLFGLPQAPTMVGQPLCAAPAEPSFRRHALHHNGHGQFLDYARVGKATYLQLGGRTGKGG